MGRSFLSSLLSGWRPARPILVDRVRTLEVPVVTETKRLLAKGQYERAVLFAYPRALEDLERAYGVVFSPEWTHEEIHVHGMRPEMGALPELFLRLHALYEPVRYGRWARRSPLELEGILHSIYSQRPMWQLYTELLIRPSEDVPDADAPTVAARAQGGGA